MKKYKIHLESSAWNLMDAAAIALRTIAALLQNYQTTSIYVSEINGSGKGRWEESLDVQQPSAWCEHISLSISGKYCYNGLDIGHWLFCPKCGKPKPLAGQDDSVSAVPIQPVAASVGQQKQ